MPGLSELNATLPLPGPFKIRVHALLKGKPLEHPQPKRIGRPNPIDSRSGRLALLGTILKHIGVQTVLRPPGGTFIGNEILFGDDGYVNVINLSFE